MKSLSIITPIYNEQESLPHYVSVVTEQLISTLNMNVEILFVDDGSVDESWNMIQQITSKDPRFKGIKLSRNFGAHNAISAGIEHSKSDAIVILACDLQDSIEAIHEFIKKWNEGYQIVWGKRLSRKDPAWRVICSKILHRLLVRYAFSSQPNFQTGSFFLIDKVVANAYRAFSEKNRLAFALVAWSGFRQTFVEYNRAERKAGKSGWTFGKMLRSSYDLFLGFSHIPVKIITVSGIILCSIAMSVLIYVLASWVRGHPLPGYTSMMATIMFFFGVQSLILGLIGEYLFRIYIEVINRPLYLIADTTFKLRSETMDVQFK